MSRSIENPISHRQHALLLGNQPCEQTPRNQYSCDKCGWRRTVNPHSVEQGWAVTQDCFERIQGDAVTYKVKPGREEDAILNWWRHGICLKCGHRSITGGTCVHCGFEYKEQIPEKIILIIKTENQWYAQIPGEMNNYRDSAYRAALCAYDNGADYAVVPEYSGITSRMEGLAELEVRKQADAALIANANSLENFSLWASGIIIDAVVGAINPCDKSEGDWLNVFCAHKSMREDERYSPHKHPFVKKVSGWAWEDLRK
jgi:hypothetical protein